MTTFETFALVRSIVRARTPELAGERQKRALQEAGFHNVTTSDSSFVLAGDPMWEVLKDTDPVVNGSLSLATIVVDRMDSFEGHRERSFIHATLGALLRYFYLHPTLPGRIEFEDGGESGFETWHRTADRLPRDNAGRIKGRLWAQWNRGHPGAPNVLRRYDGFYISWNPDLVQTAIWMETPNPRGKYYVLDGNHATALREIADASGLDGCLKYFAENIDQASYHSEHAQDEGTTRQVRLPQGSLPELATLKVGDWLQIYPTGDQPLRVEVIEDRGLIGKDGRQIFRVRSETAMEWEDAEVNLLKYQDRNWKMKEPSVARDLVALLEQWQGSGHHEYRADLKAVLVRHGMIEPASARLVEVVDLVSTDSDVVESVLRYCVKKKRAKHYCVHIRSRSEERLKELSARLQNDEFGRLPLYSSTEVRPFGRVPPHSSIEVRPPYSRRNLSEFYDLLLELPPS